MTPNEYRQKHKRCATCVYYGGNNLFCTSSCYCLVKNRTTYKTRRTLLQDLQGKRI